MANRYPDKMQRSKLGERNEVYPSHFTYNVDKPMPSIASCFSPIIRITFVKRSRHEISRSAVMV